MGGRLLLATNNKGKALEYRRLLSGVPFELVSPRDMGITTEVEEVGDSFEENARLKATALAAESAGQTATLARLQKDGHYQGKTDDYMQSCHKGVHEFPSPGSVFPWPACGPGLKSLPSPQDARPGQKSERAPARSR